MRNVVSMNARAVDDAALQLRELRREAWEDLGLGALALALAVAAAQLLPGLAFPLFVGGLAIGARGMRALFRRWDLVDRLAGEGDAYVISEVLDYASRENTMERRRSFAALIRAPLDDPAEDRLRIVAEELEALAIDLEDGELELEPSCAVACRRLLSDLDESPLLNPALRPEELRSRIHHIRHGFGPRPRDGSGGKGDRPG
jgi:hypothetical protein